MRRIFLTLAATALALPVSVAVPAGSAMAKPQHRVYHARTHVQRCRYSSGTTGLVAGGVAGAVVGGQLIGGGLAGPLVGAAGGALAGRAIDRGLTAHKRCH